MDIVNIITLIVAIIACFFGYRLNKSLSAVIGLIVGFRLGLTFLPGYIADQTMVYILSVIIGIIVGFLAYNMYLIGVFILCAMAAYTLCGNIGLNSNVRTFVGMVVGLIAGILGVNFTRLIVIIASSFAGASLLVETGFTMFNFQNSTLSLVLSIVLAVMGMAYQFSQKDTN